MRPTTISSGKRRLFLVPSLEIYFSWGVLTRYPLGNSENNILNKILKGNKLMSFSGLFLLKILNVAQGYNSKIQLSKSNSDTELQKRPEVVPESN